MSSGAEVKAALYVGAIATTWAGTNGGPQNPQVLYRASASATNTQLTLPTVTAGEVTLGLGGKWIDLYSSDVAFQYAFGIGSAPTLVHNESVTIGTGDVNAGPSLPPGVVHSRRIPAGATHLALIAAASPTGIWEVVLSEAPG